MMDVVELQPNSFKEKKQKSNIKRIFVLESFSGVSYVTEFTQNKEEISTGKIINFGEFVGNLNDIYESNEKAISGNYSNEVELIDPRILVSKPNLLVWTYTPSPEQFIYYKYGKQGYAGRFNWPTLLFVRKGRALSVAVIRSSKNRPTLDTQLYQPPFPNTDNGKICLGSVSLPEHNDIEKITIAYLDSTKTHFNGEKNHIFRNEEIPKNYAKWLKSKAKNKVKISELKPLSTLAKFIKY